MLRSRFCYAANVKTLVCPRCQSSVDSSASVCKGCHAEIVRGASRKEKTTAGCLAMGIGLLVTLIAIGAMLPSLGAPKGKGLRSLSDRDRRREWCACSRNDPSDGTNSKFRT